MNSKSLKDCDGELFVRGSKNHPDSVFFVCPSCDSGHGIAVSWEAPSMVSDGVVWAKAGGSTVDDITITPSINCDVPQSDGSRSTCRFHGWITNGQVTW